MFIFLFAADMNLHVFCYYCVTLINTSFHNLPSGLRYVLVIVVVL